MAQVVFGDREVLDQIMFGSPPPMLQQYIASTQQRFMGTLNDIGMQFANTANNLFARLDSSEAMRLARSALRAVEIYGVSDVVQEISSLEKLRIAPSVMIPYIMACPELTDLYNEGVLDAYDGRWTPTSYSHQVGWDNPYYAQVMQGHMEFIDNEETGESQFQCTSIMEDDFFDDLLALLPEEADDVITTWDHIRWYIKQKHDVTSIYESQLP